MVDSHQQTNTNVPLTQHQQGTLSVSAQLLSLAAYTALTLVLTYPVALRLFSEVAGGGDAWHNVWNLWWVKQALVDRHINPYHTDMLYYPGGINLYLHTLTLTAGLISIPLQLLGVGMTATYNLVLLLSFVLAGYGAFLLCHYLTANRWASFLGGAIFTFCPYHFAHLLGHMNLVSTQWIPFYVLALLRTLNAGGREARGARSTSGLKYAAATGALLALNAYTDWLYAVFLVLFTVLLVTWRLLVPSERRLFHEAGTGWAEGSLRMLVGGAAFLVLTAPVLLPTLAETQQGYAQQSRNETLVYSSDVIQAFTPSEMHPIWGNAVSERISGIGPYMPQKSSSERVVFLGYTALGLAIYAGRRLRASRHVRFWLFAALSTWVLSLGPVLHFFGRSRIPLLGGTVPLPYEVLYQLPLFNVARTPSRITVLTMLAMSVLAALATAELLAHSHKGTTSVQPRKSGRWVSLRHAGVVLGLLMLTLFEYLAMPFPTAAPGWNIDIYQKFAAEPGRFAVLELPLRPVGDYMAYQTVHNKPIVGGFLARQAPYPLVEQTPVLTYMLDTTKASEPFDGQVAGGKGVQTLKDLGVKYVIVHWWLLTPDQKKEMEAKLTMLLVRPPDFVYPANQVAAWQIAP